MTRLLPAALLVVLPLACQVGLVQSPDRADDQNVEGPPPPADFHCEQGRREVRDTNKDGKPDQVVYLLTSGATVCSTEDQNQDGKIDRWNKHEGDRIVEQAADTDYDGKLDRRGVDTDKDGKIDAFSPYVIHPLVPPLAPAAPAGT